MNLMFRKNFREGGAKSGGGGGTKMSNTKALSRNQNKRSREQGYGNVDAESTHYRTHIFFSPSRSGTGADFEGLLNHGEICCVNVVFLLLHI